MHALFIVCLFPILVLFKYIFNTMLPPTCCILYIYYLCPLGDAVQIFCHCIGRTHAMTCLSPHDKEWGEQHVIKRISHSTYAGIQTVYTSLSNTNYNSCVFPLLLTPLYYIFIILYILLTSMRTIISYNLILYTNTFNNLYPYSIQYLWLYTTRDTCNV